MQLFDISFILKPILPYFEITNTLGHLAILVRRHRSFFQVASNSLQTHCFNQKKTKHNRDMVPDSIIIFILLLINRFCLKNKTLTLFYQLYGAVHYFDFMLT